MMLKKLLSANATKASAWELFGWMNASEFFP